MTENVRDGQAMGEDVQQPAPDQAPDDVTASAPEPADDAAAAAGDRVGELERLVTERTSDLQRLQAEYVNYKKRVDRDRDIARGAGVERVLTELLPVFDALWLAESHGELTGGFRMVADELDKVAARHGLVPYGEKGDEFDPRLHEALMHLHLPGVTVTTCSEVMQRGYKLNDRVLRPARVAVSDPDPDAVAADQSGGSAEEGGDHEQ